MQRGLGNTVMLVLATVALAIGVGQRASTADAELSATRAPRIDTQRRCAPAAFRTVRLPTVVTVDEIRVVVDRRSPDLGAASVRVATGASDRIVRIRGSASKAVSFTPALYGAEFDVMVDPVFTAAAGSCIDRVELLHGGLPVAVVEP